MLTRLYDATDYVLDGDIEKMAEVASNLDSSIRDTHIPSIEELASKDSDQFAVTLYHPRNGLFNKYATYTKGLAQLNTELLKTQINELPDEILKVAATNLEKAASHYEFEFPEELKQYTIEKLASSVVDITTINKLNFNEKLASAKPLVEEVYALPEKKKYLITDDLMVKKAESYFNTYSRDMEIDDRITFATNVTNRMKTLNIEPGNYIEKWANVNFKEKNSDIDFHINSRISLTHDEESQDLYRQLLEKTSEWEPVKLASALGHIDEKSGLYRHYGNRVSDPVDVVFGIVKEASYEIDGKVWKESDFNKIANFDFLDKNTIEDLKSPEKVNVFKSLPSPIREKIANEIFSR